MWGSWESRVDCLERSWHSRSQSSGTRSEHKKGGPGSHGHRDTVQRAGVSQENYLWNARSCSSSDSPKECVTLGFVSNRYIEQQRSPCLTHPHVPKTTVTKASTLRLGIKQPRLQQFDLSVCLGHKQNVSFLSFWLATEVGSCIGRSISALLNQTTFAVLLLPTGEPQSQAAFWSFHFPAKLAVCSLSLARSPCLLLHGHLIRCHGPWDGHTHEQRGAGSRGQGANIPWPIVPVVPS